MDVTFKLGSLCVSREVSVRDGQHNQPFLRSPIVTTVMSHLFVVAMTNPWTFMTIFVVIIFYD